MTDGCAKCAERRRQILETYQRMKTYFLPSTTNIGDQLEMSNNVIREVRRTSGVSENAVIRVMAALDGMTRQKVHSGIQTAKSRIVALEAGAVLPDEETSDDVSAEIEDDADETNDNTDADDVEGDVEGDDDDTGK